MNAPEEPRLRAAEAGDVAGLCAFIHPFIEAGRILPRTEDELADLVPNGFVVEYQGRIVGLAALEVYSAKLAEIRSLVVDPAMQGRGIGRRLVDACVKRAHDQKILEVLAITSQDEFFKSCGFDFTLPGEKKALFIRTRDDV